MPFCIWVSEIMEYFSFSKACLSLLTCPQCLLKKTCPAFVLVSSEIGIYFKCSNCHSFYPLKQVPYISNICSQKNCSQECICACSRGALVTIKNERMYIDYEKCQFCSQCVDVCPLKAIFCFWTPFFISSEVQHSIKEESSIVEEKGVAFSRRNTKDFIYFRPQVLLNSLDTALGVSSLLDYYSFLEKDISESFWIFLSNKYSNGNLRALIEENYPSIHVVSADTNIRFKKYANHYFSPHEFIYNGEALPLPSEKIDIVTFTHSMRPDYNTHEYLKEMHRILKWKGTLFVMITPSVRFLGHIAGKFIKHSTSNSSVYNVLEKDWSKSRNENISFVDSWRFRRTMNWEDLYAQYGFQLVRKQRL